MPSADIPNAAVSRSKRLRTAIFRIPEPTRHARAILERAFGAYSHAYSELLYIAFLRYGREDDLACGHVPGLDALRGLATYALDARTSAPHTSARTLSAALYASDQLPPRAVEALSRLPSRLRQSAREHAGQTLLSYIALADDWLTASPTTRGGAPAFPRLLRPSRANTMRRALLAEFAQLADNLARERDLVARLLRARTPHATAIPFLGVTDTYGCGLYYAEDRRAFFVRLDLLPPDSRLAAPLRMPGVYVSLKTGALWMSDAERRRRLAPGAVADSTADSAAESEGGALAPSPERPAAAIASFGKRRGMLWLPLLLDESPMKAKLSYHERALRFTHAAYLPQRGKDPTHPLPANPVTAKLVRRSLPRDGRQHVTYALHVTFELPLEALALAPAPALPGEQRPLLAVNRGLVNLYAAALLSPDGREERTAFVADGRTLLARTAALERTQSLRQQHGIALRVQDRRRARIAAGEIAVCANQIVEVARMTGAQVVMEDLADFARGTVPRARTSRLRKRQQAMRALLGRRQFQALHAAVASRLALVGLPPIRTVSAAYISRTCTTCGHRDTRTFAEQIAQKTSTTSTESTGADTVPDPRRFICPACSTSHDVDLMAAVNIGRKLLWMRWRGEQKAAQIPERDRTSWDTFAHMVVSALLPAPLAREEPIC